MNELEKQTKDMVLVDTNVVINLEQRKCSNIDLMAIQAVLMYGVRPFLTDLSFCELVIGSTSISIFKDHCKELNEMEFLLCGDNEELSNYLSEIDFNAIHTEVSFSKFRKDVINLRNKTLFPMFYALINLYIKTSIMVFQKTDKEYWDYAFFIFNEIFIKHSKEYDDILYDCYKTFVDDKEESKMLVSGLFIEFLIAILIKAKPDKYKEDEARAKLEQCLNSKNYSKMFKTSGLMSGEEDDYWLEKSYIVKSRKIIDKNNDFPIIADGICFINSQIIFHNANYSAHDLIDLYNIYFSAKQNVTTHYFTNDKKRWLTFSKIEKMLRPELKFNFNK